MRRARRMMGVGVLVVLGAAACAGPGQDAGQGPVPSRAVVSESEVPDGTVPAAADVAATPGPIGDDEVVQPVPTTTTTTTGSPDTTTPDAQPPEVDTAEVDALLAELDSQLAGLDSLLNDAAAAMAAEEGEILP